MTRRTSSDGTGSPSDGPGACHPGLVRRAASLGMATAGVCLLLTGCAANGSGSGSPSSAPTSSEPSGASSPLVLQVRYAGGLAGPASWGPRVPLVSVYADGRVISEGPEPAISPPPALPDVQVERISDADLGRLRDDAVAAGV